MALGFALVLLLGPLTGRASEPKRFIILLPENFSGWACADFGVAGADPLPREGDAYVIRVKQNEVLKTSDKSESYMLMGEVWIESGGQRRRAPIESQRLHRSITDSRNPVEHHCVFFGSEDEADAATDPLEDKDRREARGVTAAERQALLDLFEATGGALWKHRVGWQGPAGTECRWHGVRCEIRFEEPTFVVGLDLSENGLVGSVPSTLAALSRLESLFLFDNRLSGRLPDPLLERWVTGALQVSADAAQLTSISEVEFESSAAELLCASHRIVLRADGRAQMFTERCRNASPDDRTTFCEVKEGRILVVDFARLGWAMEKAGFLGLKPDYSRNVTHGSYETIIATRGGQRTQVVNYADAGPLELWQLQRAIEGVAASAEWSQTTTRPICPLKSN